MSIPCDTPKLDATYAFRIPEHLKSAADILSINDKHGLNEHLRTEFAKYILNAVVRTSSEKILSDPKALETILAAINTKDDKKD